MTKPLILGVSGLAGSGKDTVASFLPFVRVALADPLKRICQMVYDFSEEQLWGPSQERNKPDKRYPRDHSWVETGYAEFSCACCGQTTGRRRIEDDVVVPDTEDAKRCFLTPRYALQQLGTEWGRGCYGDTWVAKCLRTAHTLTTESGWSYNAKEGLSFESSWGVSQAVGPAAGVVITDVRFWNEIRAIQAAGGKVVRVVRPEAGLKGSAGQHASEAEMAGIPESAFDAIIVNDRTLDHLRETTLDVVSKLRR